MSTTAATATTTTVTTAVTAALTTALTTASKSKVTVPPEFKGTESAMRWFARFEICSRSNGWDEQTMYAQVLPLMGGDALDLLLDKSLDSLTTYKEVKEFFVREFDNKELREYYVREFKTRNLREGEEFNVFMRALKILALKAYPDFDDAPRDALVADRYKEEMPERVRAVLPLLTIDERDLDQLVSETRRLAKATGSGIVPPAVAQVSARAETAGGAVGVTNDMILSKLMDMETRFAQMSTAHGNLEVMVNSLYAKPATGGAASGGKPKSGPLCYKCHNYGHFKRDCP